LLLGQDGADVLDERELPLLVLVDEAHGLVVGGRRDEVVGQREFAGRHGAGGGRVGGVAEVELVAGVGAGRRLVGCGCRCW